ncbi:hypothetical protein K1X76_06140 [bacterium]|nr:hypothetical protein [bacterium]
MSATLSLAYTSAALDLGALMDDLYLLLEEKGLLTPEKKQEILNKYEETKAQWNKTIESYRQSLQALPVELKKRPFIKQALADLEKFEGSLKHFYEAHQLDATFNNLKKNAETLKEQLTLLSDHPLIEKFLRGEPILASKKTIQWGRKFGHAAFGIFFITLFYYSHLPQNVIWGLTGAFLVWAFTLETSRHLNPKINDWVCKHFKPIMREAEKTRINSAIFYIVAMLGVYLIFPQPVTMLTMMFVAFGDTAAGIVGVYWGKTKLPNGTSLEGFLGCFTACALSSFVCAGFLFASKLSGLDLFLFSAMGGIVGAVAESSFKKIDDNLVIPLLSAPSLWGIMHLFNIL